MFELMDTCDQQAVIKVIGVGGGGGNAVNQMVAASIEGVDFINANTDSQALNSSSAPTVLQLGTNLTKGLGCGADPSVGRQAAVEDRERVAEVLEGADMVFNCRNGWRYRNRCSAGCGPGCTRPWHTHSSGSNQAISI